MGCVGGPGYSGKQAIMGSYWEKKHCDLKPMKQTKVATKPVSSEPSLKNAPWVIVCLVINSLNWWKTLVTQLKVSVFNRLWWTRLFVQSQHVTGLLTTLIPPLSTVFVLFHWVVISSALSCRMKKKTKQTTTQQSAEFKTQQKKKKHLWYKTICVKAGSSLNEGDLKDVRGVALLRQVTRVGNMNNGWVSEQSRWC